eukprot:SAG31_NODE_4446_length_3223_cov_12.388922_2_plen_131_part_00
MWESREGRGGAGSGATDGVAEGCVLPYISVTALVSHPLRSPLKARALENTGRGRSIIAATAAAAPASTSSKQAIVKHHFPSRFPSRIYRRRGGVGRGATDGVAEGCVLSLISVTALVSHPLRSPLKAEAM